MPTIYMQMYFLVASLEAMFILFFPMVMFFKFLCNQVVSISSFTVLEFNDLLRMAPLFLISSRTFKIFFECEECVRDPTSLSSD